MGQKVHPLGFRLGITQEHKGQWFEETKTYPSSLYQDFVLRNCLLNNFKNADITSIDIERSFNQVVIKVTAARSKLLIANIKQTTNYLNGLLRFMTTQTNNLTSATSLAKTDLSLTALNKWNSKIAHEKHLLLRSQKVNKSLNSNNQKTETNQIGEIETPNDSTQNIKKEDIEENTYEPKLSLLVGSSSRETVANSAFLRAKIIQEQLEKRVPFRKAVKAALRKGRKGMADPKGIKIQISGRLNGAEIARSEWIRQGRVPLHTLRAQVDYCSHEANTQYGILGIKVWVFQGYKE